MPNLRETSGQTVPEDSMVARLAVKPSQHRAGHCAHQLGAFHQDGKMAPEGMGPGAASATGGLRALCWHQSGLGVSWEPRAHTFAGCLLLTALFSSPDLVGVVLLVIKDLKHPGELGRRHSAGNGKGGMPTPEPTTAGALLSSNPLKEVSVTASGFLYKVLEAKVTFWGGRDCGA